MRESPCKSCNGFGYIRLPDKKMVTNERGEKQLQWFYRKVKCAACYVQLELSL